MTYEQAFGALLNHVEAALQKSLAQHNAAVQQGDFETAGIESDRQRNLVNARHQLQSLQELWPSLIGKVLERRATTLEEEIEKPRVEGRPIFVNYKRRRYEAILLDKDRIRYQGKKYSSPSAAATAITGNRVNGWKFWRYLDEQGREHPIDNLR